MIFYGVPEAMDEHRAQSTEHRAQRTEHSEQQHIIFINNETVTFTINGHNLKIECDGSSKFT